jgi:competence protein ComEA
MLPQSLRGARTAPTAWALGGVGLILLIVAVVLGVRVARAGAASAPTVVMGGSVSALGGPAGESALVSRSIPPAFASGSATGATAAAMGPSGSSGGSGVVVAHVVGAVARPGIVRLPAGSRVVDAVIAAGGSTRTADVSAVNLARPLIDGEQIVVPVRGQVAGAPATAPGSGVGAAAGPAVAGLVDLNAATLAQLDSLPGVGPVLAQRILDWRVAHGRFTSIDELGEVDGIGEKALARLKPKVRI